MSNILRQVLTSLKATINDIIKTESIWCIQRNVSIRNDKYGMLLEGLPSR